MDYNSLSDDDLIALSQKNYDALSDEGLLFLAQSKTPEKRKTTVLENFGIGLNQAAQPFVKAGGLIGGGIADAVGATDAADSIYKGMEDLSSSMNEYWNPADAEQSFGGKLSGMVGTLPAQLLAMPLSPFDTGQSMIAAGEDLSTAQAGTALDTVGNVAGVMLPGMIGKSALTKMASGAGINVAQDVGVRKAIQGIADTETIKKQFEPTAETSTLAGILGAGTGALHHLNRGDGGQVQPTRQKEQPKQEPTDTASSLNELDLLNRSYTQTQDKLQQFEALEQELVAKVEAGDTSKEMIEMLTSLENEKNKLQQTLTKIESIFDDPNQVPDSVLNEAKLNRDFRLHEKIASLPRRPKRVMEDVTLDDVTRIDHEIAEADDHTIYIGGKDPHTITYKLGDDGRLYRTITYPDGTIRRDQLTNTKDGDEVWVTPEEYAKGEYYPQQMTPDQLKTWLGHEHPNTTKPTEPKQSPAEVAILKIDQAIRMVPDQLQTRLQRTLEGLEALEQRKAKGDMPGEEYSARKAAMEQEVKAYNDLLAGKEPDLSWFKGEDPRPEPVRQGETYDEYVARTTLDTKPEGRRAMSDQEWSDAYTIKYGPPEAVRTQHEVLDRVPSREPVDVGGLDVDPELRSTVRRSAKQVYQHHKFESEKLQRILDNVNRQIAAHESGLTPSGTFDIAKALEMRTSLEAQVDFHRNALENVLRHSPEIRDSLNKPVETANTVVDVSKPIKVDSIADAIKNHINNLATVFTDNLQLFNHLKDSQVFFDKNIPVEMQRVMRHFVNVTGLGKDRIFFVDSTINNTGKVAHFGNTTVVFLNREALAKTYGNKAFGTIRVAAHEIGHVLFNKFLQSTIVHTDQLHQLDKAFNDFVKSNKIEPILYGDTRGLVTSQQKFHEFFAERTARALMYNHALGAFAAKSKYLQGFSKLINASFAMMRKHGFSITKENFVDEIVREIIDNNQKSIAETGQTIFEKLRTEQNDKAIMGNKDPEAFPYHNKTLEDVMQDTLNRGWIWTDAEKKAMMSMKLDHDVVPFSTRTLDALATGSTYISSKMFGKTGLAQILRDNPIIQQVYWHIRDAEQKASKISNSLWFGDVAKDVWQKLPLHMKLSKVKTGDSPYMLVKNGKAADFAAVHDVFQKGFEEGLEYEQSLTKYGNSLSSEQRTIFESLSKMFTKQYEETVKVQQDLDKKNIMPRRAGWYPSVRTGDYFVDISFQGSPAYRQHFKTPAEGKAFLQKLQDGKFKHLDVSPVTKVDPNASNALIEAAETLKKIVEQKFPNSNAEFTRLLDDVFIRIIERGGKLGKHHQHRANILGYKGSEVLLSTEERGKSFKEAIQLSVTDYTGTLRKMMINHHTDPMLKLGNLAETNPRTHQAASQMVDSALNRVENKIEGLDVAVRNTVDDIAKFVVESAGKEFKPHQPVFDTVKNGLLEAFYLTKLMAKPVFVVGQALSSPIQAVRHMAYDGGFRAYWSYGKGLYKLATGDQELRNSIFDVSQTTNTFEPQFVEALHLSKSDNSFMERVKKYVFLNKLNESSDSFSRLVTYAAMYEHYKGLGKSNAEAQRLAMHGTDTTMVQYSRSEAAPMFQHMGIVGEAMRPLQTFGQAQLANIVSDIKHFETMKPSTWAPLLSYGLMASMLGGVVSVQFIQEYELLRKWLASKFPDYAPPSTLDLVARDDSFLDRVLPHSDAGRQAVLYGLPSLSGIDLSSSIRSNETLATVLMGVLYAEEDWQRLMPLISFSGDVVAGASTLAGAALGVPTTDAELRKGIEQALPAGPIAYGAKELAGVNTTKVFGEDTGMVAGGFGNKAVKPRTTEDIVAGLMGTKSTEERYSNQVLLQASQETKNMRQRLKKLAELAVDTGDQQYMKKIVELEPDEKQLENALGSELYGKLVDQETRNFVPKSGSVPNTTDSARKIKQIFNFRSGQ